MKKNLIKYIVKIIFSALVVDFLTIRGYLTKNVFHPLPQLINS